MVAVFLHFCGWCIESAIVTVTERRPTNRGFLRGPLLPLYGFGAIAILLVSLPVRTYPPLVFLCGMAATTALEYFTGWLMETLFKTKYWDYSGKKCSLHGRIWLVSSLFWGVLSLVLTYLLHAPVERLVLSIDRGGLIVTDTAVSIFVLFDTYYAVRAAVDFRRLLESAARLRAEIGELREQLTQQWEDNERLTALRERMEHAKASYSAQVHHLTMVSRRFFRVNPTARSKRFDDMLNELKSRLAERRKPHDD